MGKNNVYDKIVMQNKKILTSKKFIHKSPSKRRFWNGIYSLLMRADARGGAYTPFTACDAYRYCAGRALLMTSQNRSRTKYLLPTDCIVVLESYFNFTKKSNLVGNL